jgi:hypothetical protein
MTNKLFIKRTEIADKEYSYSLRKSIEDTDDVTKYKPVLEKGNLPKLLHSLSDLPDEFYKGGVKVNYGSESEAIKIPEHIEESINSFVRTLERIAFEKFLSK